MCFETCFEMCFERMKGAPHDVTFDGTTGLTDWMVEPCLDHFATECKGATWW